MNIPEAVIVKILPTKIWIESDVCGTRHVVAQHEGMEVFTVASFFYGYGYTDNSSLHRLATKFAVQLGATEPVEDRFRMPDVARETVPCVCFDEAARRVCVNKSKCSRIVAS